VAETNGHHDQTVKDAYVLDATTTTAQEQPDSVIQIPSELPSNVKQPQASVPEFLMSSGKSLTHNIDQL
jgi:hypothetical protein